MERFGFTDSEYTARLEKVRHAMASRGIELLIVVDPANMAWLTGYDGWSFYTPQCVLVSMDQPPFWWGRAMDAPGARQTVYMPKSQVIEYPDTYVMAADRHPLELLGRLIREKGWARGWVGVEMSAHFYTARIHQVLSNGLTGTRISDASGIVNKARAVKSEVELAHMRKAGTIITRVFERVFELIEPGMRKNDLVADIYHSAISGTEEFGGDYAAIVPMVPSGADAAAAHLTWDDRPFERNTGTFFELAGCYRRYHCPLSRTVFLGHAPEEWKTAEQALQDGTEAALSVAKAGATCSDVAVALNKALARFGLTKDSRCGYGVGIGYPPDWGEQTMSFRVGDETPLEANMTFHFMPALWFRDWGLEMSETIVITETGAEKLAHVPGVLVEKT